MMTKPEQALLDALRAAGKTLATAESCTGGLLGKRLTDLPGSSAAYVGGVISYSNGVKEKLLGVSHDDLARLGAVSEPVARQMAAGVRARLGTEFGVGITGIAGPDSDDTRKPVGLVYIAATDGETTNCDECHFTGARAEIRAQSCEHAMQMLLRLLGREIPAGDDWDALYAAARAVQNDRQVSDYVEAGGVAAAILSGSGKIYTGVCVDTCSTLGVCAERSAIFRMLTAGERTIRKMLAIMPDGRTGAPCGACRELMVQLNPGHAAETEIMLDYKQKKTATLADLTPAWWIP